MKYVTLKNTLDGNIIIQEGNGGVLRQLAVVHPGEGFTLKIDPNATYREYILIALPDQEKLPPISSDDLTEFKEIEVRRKKAEVKKDDDPIVPKYYWVGDPTPEDPVPSNPGSAQAHGWKGRLKALFGFS